MKNRITSLLTATIILFSSALPEVSAGLGYFYEGAPDFSISSIYQAPDAYTYTIRVCNIGDTPDRASDMRISLERSGKPAESRTFANTYIANGSCQDFQMEGVYAF